MGTWYMAVLDLYTYTGLVFEQMSFFRITTFYAKGTLISVIEQTIKYILKQVFSCKF